jgi:hypothetical protein
VPPEIKQLGLPIGVPDNEQLVSSVEKPEPETVTDDPTGAEAELNVMNGPEVRT